MTNKILLNSLKKRSKRAKDKWVNELSIILWAYKTTSRRPTRVTPFALAFGMEVVIPTEIGMPTVRTTMQESRSKGQDLERHLDWVDEERETATIRMDFYQQRAMT